MNRKRIILVDGYNVIHKVPALDARMERSLESARTGLMQLCAGWLATRRDVWRFYVVFDGSSAVGHSAGDSLPGVRAVYTASGETADDRILTFLREHGGDCDYAVVSDDNYVRGTARQHKAEVMSVSEFEQTARGGGRGKRRPRAARETDDDDRLHPRDEQQVNEDLMREWGIE